MTKQKALRQAYTFIGQECDRIKSKMDEALREMGEMVEENNEVGFMATKGDLLECLNTTTLLVVHACPYCLFNGNMCNICSYGKAKGECGKGDSVFNNLCVAKDDIKTLIIEYANNCPEIVEAKTKVKRVLKLGNIVVDGDQVSFQIVEQSHRESFGFFIATNDIEIHTSEYPMIYDFRRMYCWGWDESRDNDILTTDLKTFTRIVDAVKEYNENKGEE